MYRTVHELVFQIRTRALDSETARAPRSLRCCTLLLLWPHAHIRIRSHRQPGVIRRHLELPSSPCACAVRCVEPVARKWRRIVLRIAQLYLPREHTRELNVDLKNSDKLLDFLHSVLTSYLLNSFVEN